MKGVSLCAVQSGCVCARVATRQRLTFKAKTYQECSATVCQEGQPNKSRRLQKNKVLRGAAGLMRKGGDNGEIRLLVV